MTKLKTYVAIDTVSAISDTKFEKDFPTIPHSAYEWERRMCSYVRAGDVEGYRQFMDFMVTSGQMDSVTNTTMDSVMHGKYMAVSMIAVVTRVAINSGADELTAYQISDQYLYFLDKCQDSQSLFAELVNSCLRMIAAVRDAQDIAKDNIYFTRCREYISSHLGQKITAATLADICGLTPNYLSTIFKNASGKTIKEYVMQQKIQVAKQLLLSPDHTTSEIASFLGFASQSHFIDCFKKQVGTTPRRWRMRNEKGTGVELYPGV